MILDTNILPLVLRKDGSVGLTADWPAGAYDIKALSFSIGANKLTTSEWAFLDGQDQAVKTTDNVTFSTIKSTGSTASGTNVIAFGQTCSATGNYSLALGYVVGKSVPTASGIGSIAIGGGASSSSNGCIALGHLSSASSVLGIAAAASFAAGYNSSASGDLSLAFGAQTVASGTFATALGYGATASGDSSTAIGNVTASNTNSFAIGVTLTNNTVSSFMVGFSADPMLRLTDTYIYLGKTTNYASFAADGEIGLHGTARVNKEIIIGAGSFHKGSSSPDDVYLAGGSHVLAFDKTTTQHGHFTTLIPMDFAAGTEISIEADWSFDTVEADHYMTWEMEYILLADGEDPAGALTSTSQKSVISTGNNDKQIHTTFATGITGAVADDTLLIRFSRDADHITDDDLDQDANLIAIHLHYISDKLGEAT